MGTKAIVRSYELNVIGLRCPQTITRPTAGQAKYAYYRSVKEFLRYVRYIDITCRSLGGVFTDEEFLRTARYRGVPFARIGMRVCVPRLGEGVLVGKNSAANFEVLFTTGKWRGRVLSCHPNDEIQYLDDAGQLIKDFHTGKGDSCVPSKSVVSTWQNSHTALVR